MSQPIHRFYVGIGSNMNPEKHVEQAVQQLATRSCLIATSTFYWNEALGADGTPSGQERFLNGVCCLESKQSAEGVKKTVLHPVETVLGRVRTTDKYAARPIDLDVLLQETEIETTGAPNWQVLDDAIAKYPFLGVPLFELIQGRNLRNGLSGFTEKVLKMSRDGLEKNEAITTRLRERIMR